MGSHEEAFLRELHSAFKGEADDHLRAITSGLLELERSLGGEKRPAIIEDIFREAHSLKGAARAVNMAEVEAICQSLESTFSAFKRGELEASPELFDQLHHATDTAAKLVSGAEGDKTRIQGPPELAQTEASAERVGIRVENSAPRLRPGVFLGPAAGRETEEERRKEAEEPSPVVTRLASCDSTLHRFQGTKDKSVLSETVRISAAKLDSLLVQAEELLSLKMVASERAGDLREVAATLDLWKKEWARGISELEMAKRSLELDHKHGEKGQPIPSSAGLARFLAWNRLKIEALESKLSALARSAQSENRTLGGMVDTLLEEMKEVSMLPFSSLLDLFPKLIRDLSRDEGKEVELLLNGEGVEIDKRILEEMKDPLIHLLRNCVDHGVEKPEDRVGKGKPRRGLVTVAISQVSVNKVEILVADDGAGIDTAKVMEAGVKRGLLGDEEAGKLSQAEALLLIFQSDLSTSPIVTDISGRGLGLAIVQDKVEKLGGVISVQTQPQAGSSFQIVLPVTLATLRGVFVKVAGQPFIIPTADIERAMRVKRDAIKTVEDRETISLSGRAVSLVRLGEVLELPRQDTDVESSGFVSVLVLGSTENHIAFSVDEILNEQEVLAKKLGKQLCRVPNIGGATILGSGKVVPILNTRDLLKSAAKSGVRSARPANGAQQVEIESKSILVAEDSITSRVLLKSILESAGYRVKTAVDGADAFAALKTEDFDMLVSDVEMPRMNGFDLASKVRADGRLAELPIVLVTALESREDRERGIDVGANAYIVKSSFDQSNLLGVVRRLF